MVIFYGFGNKRKLLTVLSCHRIDRVGISGPTVVTATTDTTDKLCIAISVNDLVHSCRNCEFVRPHFECFVPDMEWLVDITETDEEGRFFWSLSIILICKVIKKKLERLY